MKLKYVAAAVAVVSTPLAQAAGFYLKEQSIVSQGAAFAGAAARQDAASSIYFNPAGIAEMGSQIEGGVHLLIPDQKVTGTAAIGALSIAEQEPLSNSTIPNFYYTKPIGDGVAGFGISAPFGSKNEYAEDFIGALDSQYVELKTVDFSFAYGKQLNNDVRIGGALVYQTADIEQRKLVSSVLLGQASTAIATLKGDSTALGLTVGAQFDLENGGVLGVTYKKGLEQDIEGTNTISNAFTLTVGGVAVPIAAGSYNATGTLKLPSMTSISLIQPISDRTDLMFDVTRYGWSSYDNLTVNTAWGAPLGTQPSVSDQNYSDTTSFSLGAEHRYGNGWTARAGVHLDPTPTNDTDRSFSTPDGDRTWLAFGASKETGSGTIWDIAYTYIKVDDTTLNKTSAAGNLQATAESTFNIVSIGVRVPLN
ncbi:outer membrane protein transport protein [Litoricola sp.]|nr:outer membrane protein transport protein [Litorivicinus sp.]